MDIKTDDLEIQRSSKITDAVLGGLGGLCVLGLLTVTGGEVVNAVKMGLDNHGATGTSARLASCQPLCDDGGGGTGSGLSLKGISVPPNIPPSQPLMTYRTVSYRLDRAGAPRAMEGVQRASMVVSVQSPAPTPSGSPSPVLAPIQTPPPAPEPAPLNRGVLGAVNGLLGTVLHLLG